MHGRVLLAVRASLDPLHDRVGPASKGPMQLKGREEAEVKRLAEWGCH